VQLVLRVCVPMLRNGFECGFHPSDAARLPDFAARNSWNGGTGGTQNDRILAIFVRFSVKNSKNKLSGAQSPLKVSVAGFLVEQAPTLSRSSCYPAQGKRKNPRRFAGLSSHRGLHLWRTLLVFGATHPVRWTPSSEPLVGRFARFSQLSSTAAVTDSQRSFLGLTSQLRLIGRLGVFLSLAFRLDHDCSAPAGEWSFLPCPFGALPGPVELQLDPWPPKIPCPPLALSRILFLFACLAVSQSTGGRVCG